MTETAPAPHSPSPHEAARGYQVVARRYRPQTFTELVGQEQVVQALSNAIARNRVAHAYLFCGARGVGKTTTARILAKCLNCRTGMSAAPCNVCEACKAIGTGEDIDVLEIDGASNRGIDEIRELRSNISVRPIQSRFKIFIIDEVHMLTKEAFNALLKTLEEPPEHVKFIFCTTEADKIPITILSRCQKFEFSSLAPDEITLRLREIVAREGSTIDDTAVELLARRAAGSMRDSQSLLEQLLAFGGKHITSADVHAMFGTADDVRVARLLEAVVGGRADAVLKEVADVAREGVDLGQLLDQLLGYLRDAMAVRVGCGPELMVFCSPELQPQLVEIGGRLGLETILAMMQILVETKQKLRFSTQTRILVELALVRASRLEHLDAIPRLIQALRGQAPLQLPAGTLALAAAKRETAPPSGPRETAPPSGPRETAAVSPGLSPEVKKNALTPPERAANPPQLAPSLGEGVSDRSSEAVSARELPAETALPEAAPLSGSEEDTSRESPSPPAPGGGISPEQVQELWRRTLPLLTDLTREHAARAGSIAIRVPNRLVIGFSRQYTFHRKLLERGENVEKIRQAFREVSGETVQVEFVEAPGDAPPLGGPAQVPSHGPQSPASQGRPQPPTNGHGHAGNHGRTAGHGQGNGHGSAAPAPRPPLGQPRVMAGPALEEAARQNPLILRAQQLFTGRVIKVEPPDAGPG